MAARDRRQQLVGIGLDLLETRPIHELALDEVAAAAGVSRTLVFHYFPSKAEFYAAVVASAGERLLMVNPGDPSMDVDQRLRGMVTSFLRLVQRKRGAYVSLVRGASGGDPRVLAMLDELRASLVVRWLDAAEWPDRDTFTQLAVRGWLGALEEVALAAPGSAQPRELIVEHLVQGLRADLERAGRLAREWGPGRSSEVDEVREPGLPDAEVAASAGHAGRASAGHAGRASAARGERVVEVPVRRVPGWLAGFEERHGAWVAEATDDTPGWHVHAVDGATAQVVRPEWLTGPVGVLDPEALAALAPAYGLVAVRRAGYAVAHFEGSRLVTSKVGHRHIHGRTAAGGWSQQRYARRRDNQADEVAEAVAAAAKHILGPVAASLAFLVTGGDRPLLAAALGQVGRPLAALPVERHIAMGTPSAQAVAGVPDQVLVIRIAVLEPDGASSPIST